MARFSVPDMTCDACVRAITQAVREADGSAAVHVDLDALIVDIDSKASDQKLAGAISEAGFTVRPAA